jgi:hypothetical protein
VLTRSRLCPEDPSLDLSHSGDQFLRAYYYQEPQVYNAMNCPSAIAKALQLKGDVSASGPCVTDTIYEPSCSFGILQAGEIKVLLGVVKAPVPASSVSQLSVTVSDSGNQLLSVYYITNGKVYNAHQDPAIATAGSTNWSICDMNFRESFSCPGVPSK